MSRVLTARGHDTVGQSSVVGIGPSNWLHGWNTPGNIFFRGEETILGTPIFGEDGFSGGTHKSLAIGTPDRSPKIGWGTTDIIDLGTFSIDTNSWGGARPAVRYTALEHNFRVDNTTGEGNPGVSALFIKQDSNVGIATTTPQAKLHVIGAAKMSNLDGSYRVPVADTELVPRKYVDDNFASIVGGASAVFVGLTTNSYNGNQSGYTTANSICAGEYTDSHICTTQEVLYTINSGNSSSVPVTTAWMSGGAPGYTANANDCQGWKSSSHGDYGKVWIKLAVGDDGFGALSWCDETAPFMCCK
jgi:hypothetical protein